MNETCGFDNYFLAILYHIRSHFPNYALLRNFLQVHTMHLHDGAALVVNSSGVPDKAFLIFYKHSGLQGYLFSLPAFAQKSHLADLNGNHRLSLRWSHCNYGEANQLQKRFEKIR
jgi:hypothetical protein